MLKVTRIKKTREIVQVVGSADNGYSLVLFNFGGRKSNKGNLGVIQVVRNDNLITDNEA